MKIRIPIKGAVSFRAEEIELDERIMEKINEKILGHMRAQNLVPTLALLGPVEFYSFQHVMENKCQFVSKDAEKGIRFNSSAGSIQIFLMERDGIEFGFKETDLTKVSAAKWTL